MQKLRILVCFTGGTIGSCEQDGCIRPRDSAQNILLDKVGERYGDNVSFDAVSPYVILSENISAVEMNMLSDCISKNMAGHYDGIIVTCGTDTIQYVAAGLSFSFGLCSVPIVLVSSNYPLERADANGIDNFVGAVEFIKFGGNGVFVSYRNKAGVTCIYRGSRVFSHGEMSDELTCVGNEPYAFHDEHIKLNPLYKRTVCGGQIKETIQYCDKPEILVISCHPGDSYNYVIDKYNAVLIKPYHSGTVDTANEHFRCFCRRGGDAGIPIFISGVPAGAYYESSEKFEEMGIIAVKNSSFPAVYMKIWAAVSLKTDIVKYVMQTVSEEYVE